MLNSTNLRSGTVFLDNNDPYKVLNYEHIKMARGGAVVKVKSQNMLSGVIKDISFSNNDKVEEADIENRNMQFLYADDEDSHFMDETDYSQYEIPVSQIENQLPYLVEGRNFQVTFFEGKPIAVILPLSLFLEVKSAPDAERGNTTNNATKRITLENGLVVDAPLFIKVGDVVKINTESGSYVSRGKS